MPGEQQLDATVDHAGAEYAADRLDEIARAVERCADLAERQAHATEAIGSWVVFFGVLVILGFVLSGVGVLVSVLGS